MADRVLRGSRMGAVSYETDRDHDLAPRRMAKYRTPNGEVFEVPFADDAEIPEEWMCKNGQVGTLMEGEGVESKPAKPPRTHWDMLRERRSIEELDVLLEERLSSCVSAAAPPPALRRNSSRPTRANAASRRRNARARPAKRIRGGGHVPMCGR